jgi:hypothetical protein
MERSQILETMSGLKLFGMKAAYDEIIATAVKRQHEPQRVVGDLLAAEIAEKQARSIKYQMTIARLPLSYGQSWCLVSGGGLLLGLLNRFAVVEADALDDLGEPVRPVQLTPVPLGRFDQLEDHGERRPPRQAALCLGGPEPDGGEGAFNRIGRPDVRPVLGR